MVFKLKCLNIFTYLNVLETALNRLDLCPVYKYIIQVIIALQIGWFENVLLI